MEGPKRDAWVGCPDDELMLAIRDGSLAGAQLAWARAEPESAASLEGSWARYHSRGTELLACWIAEVAASAVSHLASSDLDAP